MSHHDQNRLIHLGCVKLLCIQEGRKIVSVCKIQCWSSKEKGCLGSYLFCNVYRVGHLAFLVFSEVFPQYVTAADA